MVRRLSILLVTACLSSAATRADSILFVHHLNMTERRPHLKATTKSDAVSRVVAGGLGRGFTSAEQRSSLRPGNPGGLVDNTPRGSLVTSEPGQLNFDFLGNTRPQGTVNTFTRQVWRFLFQRAPKGSRGRRALAEAGGR